ncbi:plastocyanin/azurin family copper-binding protein [Haladaptatus sp. DJG-WS-42]|uniref:cupredoxin domain-containing protein n=1 Tax=Haladaptatus sp. DJG-WS-42 TaxID=3120516 RepID=UPI0030D0D4BD
MNARQSTSTRRRYLKAAGAVVTVGLAGCVSTPGESGETTTTDATGDDPGDDHMDDDHMGDEHMDDDHMDGEGDEDTHAHDDFQIGEPIASATVEMVQDNGYHFLPHVVHIVSGGTVTWEQVNNVHDTVAYHPDNGKPARIPEGAAPWRSPLMSERGDTFEVTFEQEGVYDYFCSPHEVFGMVGRVVVGMPDLDAEPAMEPPQDELPAAAREEFERYNELTREAFDQHE